MKWLLNPRAQMTIFVLVASALTFTGQAFDPTGLGISIGILGATLGATVATLADWAKRLDPDGKVPTIVELLSQTNDILKDMLYKEGNLPTGERVTVRTGLPTVAWRLLNQGIATSKSTTAQVDEHAGMLEAFSEVDKDLAELNGNTEAFRLSEAQAFIEAMNQEMASTLIYGNNGTAPEEFLGFAPRYASLSATNAQNILSAGGVGSDNTSVWLVVWGANTVFGVFPKGSKAGLVHENLGLQTVQTGTGIGTGRMRAYQDHWQWKNGLVLKDWRYAVRIANIDVSDLVAATGTQAGSASTELIKLMARAIDRIPAMGMGKPVFYANRTVMSHLRIQALNKSNSAVAFSEAINQFGERIQTGLTFLGIPVRMVDQLLETEAAVT
ncbi:MAG TPA: hypothetical protein VNK91_01920 [Burkholderiaceae bacterium]|nr:hypothetical protein [Burkholderiaceae bacterium]